MQVMTPSTGGRGLASLRPSPEDRAAREDARALEQLLKPVLDDSYILILSPKIPGVDGALRGLLIGPGGVRALLVRRWDGHFRQRGRMWEYNARGRLGWIPCRTDPTKDGRIVLDQVSEWMRDVLGTVLPVEATIAFPDQKSRVELSNNPEIEVVTRDNAPWWANSLAKARRIDERSAGRLLLALGA
jgi:hypothetical protein